MTADDPTAYDCALCTNHTRASEGRRCRYPLRPRDLGPRFRELAARGLDAQAIRAVLIEEGHGHPLVAVQRWLDRLPSEPDLVLPGDLSLTPAAEAAYPSSEPVQCPRYELPWWASEAVRAYGHVERGLARWRDLDSWMGQAIEIVGSEYGRIERAKRANG